MLWEACMNKQFFISEEQGEQLKGHNKFIEDIPFTNEDPIFNILLIATNQFIYAYQNFLEIMEVEFEKASSLLFKLYELLDKQRSMDESNEVITDIFHSFKWYIPFDDFCTLAKIINGKQLILEYLSTPKKEIVNAEEDFIEAIYFYIDKMTVWTSAINVINDRLKTSIKLKKSRKKHSIDIHKKGGLAKKAISDIKKAKAYELYEAGNYYSYAECAREIYQKVGVKDPRTIAIWLSKKYSKK